MKVFFTASLSESNLDDKSYLQKVITVLLKRKIVMTNKYYKNLGKIDAKDSSTMSGESVAQILRTDIASSNCLIAEISVPSVSLGMQIEFALTKKIPVLCLLREGRKDKLPLLLRDYKHPLLTKKTYSLEAVDEIIGNFLEMLPSSRTKFNMFITHDVDNYLRYLSENNRKPKSEILRELVVDKMHRDKQYLKTKSDPH